MFERITHSPQETAQLAFSLGKCLAPGEVLCFDGDLGAGKTLFIQHLVKALGVTEEVTSPTFNLMNVYKGRCPILHFDLYRLETEEELAEIGFYEYVEREDHLVLIEWAGKFAEDLPEAYLHICFDRIAGEENGRRLRFSVQGKHAEEWEKELNESC